MHTSWCRHIWWKMQLNLYKGITQSDSSKSRLIKSYLAWGKSLIGEQENLKEIRFFFSFYLEQSPTPTIPSFRARNVRDNFFVPRTTIWHKQNIDANWKSRQSHCSWSAIRRVKDLERTVFRGFFPIDNFQSIDYRIIILIIKHYFQKVFPPFDEYSDWSIKNM